MCYKTKENLIRNTIVNKISEYPDNIEIYTLKSVRKTASLPINSTTNDLLTAIGDKVEIKFASITPSPLCKSYIFCIASKVVSWYGTVIIDL